MDDLQRCENFGRYSLPTKLKEDVGYDNNYRILYTDSSHDNLKSIIKDLSGARAEEVLKNYHCSYSNVWKPLRGPVKDWALAICDATSVKSREEFVATDVVDPNNRLSEDLRVFHDSNHKWYYLSEQMPDELLVFRQADTDPSKLGVLHTAISNLKAGEPAYLRESIEVRALIFSAREGSGVPSVQ